MTEDQRLDFEHVLRFGMEGAIELALRNEWFRPREADLELLRALRRFVAVLERAV